MSRLKAFFAAVLAILFSLTLTSHVAFADNPAAEDHYKKGSALYDKGNYKDAIIEFNAAIELDGTQAHYYNDRGWANNYAKNYTDAEKDFNKALELRKDYTYSYCGRGYARFFSNKEDAAIEDLEKAIALDENYKIAHETLAMAYVSKNKSQEAAEHFAKAGSISLNNKNYKSAVADYNLAIHSDDSNAEYYFNRGVAYANWENHNEDAINDFLKAGNLFLDAQKYSEAQSSFGEVIDLIDKTEDKDSNDKKKIKAEACSGRAKVYQALGDNINAKNHFNYANVLFDDIGNYDDAIENVTSALLISNEPLFHVNRGITYKKTGDFDKAIADFSEAIDLDKGYMFAYQLRGDTYFESPRPNYSEALKDFEKVLELNKTSTKPLNEEELNNYHQKIERCKAAIDPNFIDLIKNSIENLDELMMFLLGVIAFNYIVELLKDRSNLTFTDAIKKLIGKGILIFVVVLAGALESKFQISPPSRYNYRFSFAL